MWLTYLQLVYRLPIHRLLCLATARALRKKAPSKYGTKLLCCHNFETICNTCERGVFYYLVWSHDQVMQEKWEYYFLIPLKNSSEFFIMLHFQELIRVLDIGTLLQVMLAILTFVRIQLYFVLRLFRSHCPA